MAYFSLVRPKFASNLPFQKLVNTFCCSDRPQKYLEVLEAVDRLYERQTIYGHALLAVFAVCFQHLASPILQVSFEIPYKDLGVVISVPIKLDIRFVNSCWQDYWPYGHGSCLRRTSATKLLC